MSFLQQQKPFFNCREREKLWYVIFAADIDSDSGYPPTDSSTVGNVQPSLPLVKSTTDVQQTTQSTGRIG